MWKTALLVDKYVPLHFSRFSVDDILYISFRIGHGTYFDK